MLSRYHWVFLAIRVPTTWLLAPGGIDEQPSLNDSKNKKTGETAVFVGDPIFWKKKMILWQPVILPLYSVLSSFGHHFESILRWQTGNNRHTGSPSRVRPCRHDPPINRCGRSCFLSVFSIHRSIIPKTFTGNKTLGAKIGPSDHTDDVVAGYRTWLVDPKWVSTSLVFVVSIYRLLL